MKDLVKKITSSISASIELGSSLDARMHFFNSSLIFSPVSAESLGLKLLMKRKKKNIQPSGRKTHKCSFAERLNGFIDPLF
jgi:hypothetical protein